MAKAVVRCGIKVDGSEPSWDDWEKLSDRQLFVRRLEAGSYYAQLSAKELKPKIVKFARDSGEFDAATQKKIKALGDSKFSTTLGSVCAMINRGMPGNDPALREDHLAWAIAEIQAVVAQALQPAEVSEDEPATHAAAQPSITIQDRLRIASYDLAAPFEAEIDAFMLDPAAYDPKQFDAIAVLREAETSAGHNRHIVKFYEDDAADVDQAIKAVYTDSEEDQQLKEAYKHLNKTQLKKLAAIYAAIFDACNQASKEAAAKRAPRKRKPRPASQIVKNFKFQKDDTAMGLVSVNPIEVHGAKEVWLYNTKTRKITRYVADALFKELSVKGASIIGFDETKSVTKTLRKPAEFLKEFKAASKVKLRTLLDSVNTVETRANGRSSDTLIILKAIK